MVNVMNDNSARRLSIRVFHKDFFYDEFALYNSQAAASLPQHHRENSGLL